MSAPPGHHVRRSPSPLNPKKETTGRNAEKETSHSVPDGPDVSSIHDSIIATYRREIEKQRKLTDDFDTLRGRLADLEQRKHCLGEAIKASENDYE